jgi:hypothetical protein
VVRTLSGDANRDTVVRTHPARARRTVVRTRKGWCEPGHREADPQSAHFEEPLGRTQWDRSHPRDRATRLGDDASVTVAQLLRLAGPVALPEDAARIVTSGRLAYVAVATSGGPLVTPVLYGVSGDSLWFLTKRTAFKTRVLRRDPRTAWVVRDGERSVAMTGRARLLSPLHATELLTGGLLAAPPAIGSWAERNPRQVAGFLRDALSRPGQAMPHDFVLARLRPETVSVVEPPAAGRRRGRPGRLDVVPARLRGLAARADGVLGLTTAGGTVALPARWDPVRWVAQVPGAVDGGPACLTFDEPVRTRASQQRGLVLRGRARVLGPAGAGTALAFDFGRATYWDGFETRTLALPR